MAQATGTTLGERIRDIRTWRKKSLRETAELAGITAGYLSQIERNLKPLERRATREGIAAALRISPSELGEPTTGGHLDAELAKAYDAVPEIEAALIETSFRESTVAPRPWAAVQADAEHLHNVLRLRSDRAGVLQMLPRHLRELSALLVTDPVNRQEILEELALSLRTAAGSTKMLGAPGLPALAALRLHTVAQELDEPAWIGLAAFMRAQVLSQGARERTRELSLAAADQLQAHLADDRARQVYGMLHLNAALGSAVLNNADDTYAHLQEAREVAASAPDPRGVGFSNLGFSRTNVAFWEVTLTLEVGDPGKVPELSASIVPERAPSRSRQGAYQVDLGRALATTKRTHDAAVTSLVRADTLAPVQTRANVWAKETVRHLLRRKGKKDDAISRELRGLAYRMGLAA